MAHPYLALTANAGLTTTTAGLSIGIQGDVNSFGGSSSQIWHRPLEINVRAAGATSTATVQIQDSADGASWATTATLTFASNSNAFDDQKYVLSLKRKFIRINVSAISGKTITGFLIMR